MTRAFAAALALATVGPTLLQAQEPPALVRWGKWGVLATALGATYGAATSHDDADADYRALERRCFSAPSSCDLGPGGSYLDPESERLYRQALDHDAVARRWLVAAEVAFTGAVILFVWDFMKGGQPEDDTIPFSPYVDSSHGRLGAQFRF